MIQLYVREQGQGEPLLLLHGNGENGGYFVHQMEALAAHYHVFALDTRGHGQSPRGKAPFCLTTFADDLLDFLEQHALDRVHLLGFSDGANIALLFALQHPERVQSLILNGGNLDPVGIDRKIQLPIEIGYAVTRFLAKWSAKAAQNRDLLGLMVHEPHIHPADLRELTMPVLVVAGTKDIVLEEHTRLIARSLPNARLCLLEGDHAVANKHPERFNPAVLDFLGQTAKGF